MPSLSVPGVTLEPRTMAHAEELFPLLAESALYEFLDETPPGSIDEIRLKLAGSESRRSPDGREHWLNWVVRDDSGRAAGYVQATVAEDGDTNVAYAIGSAFRGRGIATEAVKQMMQIVVAAGYGVRRFVVVADRENARSLRLATRLGFAESRAEKATGPSVGPGEVVMHKVPG